MKTISILMFTGLKYKAHSSRLDVSLMNVVVSYHPRCGSSLIHNSTFDMDSPAEIIDSTQHRSAQSLFSRAHCANSLQSFCIFK